MHVRPLQWWVLPPMNSTLNPAPSHFAVTVGEPSPAWFRVRFCDSYEQFAWYRVCLVHYLLHLQAIRTVQGLPGAFFATVTSNMHSSGLAQCSFCDNYEQFARFKVCLAPFLQQL